MKNMIETLLNRTSIRRYEKEAIEPDKLELIYKAIINSPTSYNGQQYCVIAIDDQQVKEEIYAITNQKQIKTCAIFLIFCADYHKIEAIAAKRHLDMPPFAHTLDGIFVGTIDATIAMCNARIMAESLGLGCCCIGYARTANPIKLSQMLNLPKGVFIVCGLAIGHPREFPDLKPKQEQSLIIHRNSYHNEDIEEKLLHYDNVIKQYNGSRQLGTSDNDWSSHIIDYYRDAMKYQLLNYLHTQGVSLEYEPHR